MFKDLAEKFAGVDKLPIEVDEVRAGLVELGYQDEVIFSPEDTDPGKLKGVIYQYTTHKAVYAPPTLVSLIVYSQNVTIEWQRIICCKEMVHICEGPLERTKTAEEVDGLLVKLLGPLSTEDYGMADFMASLDRLALYQSLLVLFPDRARQEAMELIAAGKKTPAEVANWACVPIPLAEMVISEGWPEMKKHLLDC